MSKRQRRSNGPGQSKVTGLFWILIIAIAIGAFLGTFIGKQHISAYCPKTASESHSTGHSAPPEQPSDLTENPREQKSEETKAPDVKTKASVEVRPEEKREAEVKEAPEQATPQKAESLPEPKLGINIIKPRRSSYASEISHVDRGDNKIALTFDAGASPAPTPSILRTLRAHGLHATFFLTGKWCEQNPDLVREISNEGHEIGNHTYSHPDLRRLSDEKVCEQLQKMEDIVVRLTGNSTKPFFRPPFGGRNPEVLRTAASQGYTSVYWSVDSWDAFKKGITSEEIKKRVLDRVQGGDIVLMHCGSQPTAAALPDIIRELQSRGYQIVTVSELANR